MCSWQVNRLLLSSASVSKDSALAASCGELAAAGGVGRTRRGSSTQRATPRGLDCRYRVPHLARCSRIGPSVRQQPPRFSNITETEAWHDFRFRAGEQKLYPKPLRALRIPRRVVLRIGSTFHGETALRLLLRRMRKALLCL